MPKNWKEEGTYSHTKGTAKVAEGYPGAGVSAMVHGEGALMLTGGSLGLMSSGTARAIFPTPNSTHVIFTTAATTCPYRVSGLGIAIKRFTSRYESLKGSWSGNHSTHPDGVTLDDLRVVTHGWAYNYMQS